MEYVSNEEMAELTTMVRDVIEPLWTVKQAAKHLGYSPRHIRYLCDTGDIVSVKHQGRWLIVAGFFKAANGEIEST